MPTSHVRATLYAVTDPGLTRDHNEDTFLVADLATSEAVRGSQRDLHALGPHGALYLVADGMGGAAAGELASEMAAVEIHRHMAATWRADPILSEDRFAHHLRTAVEAANALLHGYAKEHLEVRGMGTTATVAGVHGDRLYIAQIGDSRGYLVRGNVARQLTRDQSLTQRLVEVGELTEEEAETSERRNIILQALGPDPDVRVDLSWQSLQQGDVLIICSDGLSTVVRRDEIAAAVRDEPDLEKLCSSLVDLANERGGPDNITVVAVRFEGEGLPSASDEEPGYHEFLTTDERPSLQPTAAFPSPTMPPPVAPPVRRGSPTSLMLVGIAIAMAVVAGALLLAR
jgi:PPM family protein phosphatase